MDESRAKFQSTSPYAGDDYNKLEDKPEDEVFQSTSPYAGDDYNKLEDKPEDEVFQSTSPYAGDDSKTVQFLRYCNSFCITFLLIG